MTGRALLALCLGLSVGCASGKPVTRVQTFPPAPVRAVSLEIQGGSAPQRDQVVTALSTSLLRRGVQVVPKGQAGAPHLVGTLGQFQEAGEGVGTIYAMGPEQGIFEASWVLTDSSGKVIGLAQSQGDTGFGAGQRDFGDVLDGVGYGLAAFLTGRPKVGY